MAITDAWLKANSGKVREKTQVKTDREGLSARVSPKGKITFQLRYRYNGKQKRMDVGRYPLMSLKDARTEAHRLRTELESGNDPKIVRELEKVSKSEAASVEDLFTAWYEAYCKENKENHYEIKRSFELHVFPLVGSLPANAITVHRWMDILEDLAKRYPAIADRVLINAKQMMKWGVRRRLLDHNPLADITSYQDLGVKKNATTRYLNREEIGMVWEALNGSRMMLKNKIYVKLCLFYGCRKSELRVAEKRHFDLDEGVWTIPAENHKIGKRTKMPLLRPITDGARELIEEAMLLSDGPYLFANRGTQDPFSVSATEALPYNVMRWLKRHRDYHMEHWSMHDLRRTARTNFSDLAPPHICEVMLGHKLPGQWTVYDRHNYLPEQREAYSRWWERLMEITGGEA